MLTLNQVSKSYPSGWFFKKRTMVLNEISLIIEPNSFVGVVGASGSGKSTLAKLMLGLVRPDRGTIVFKGDGDLWRFSKSARRRFTQTVQFVAQHPETVFNPRLKVGNSLKEVIHHYRLCPSGLEYKLLDPLFSKLQLDMTYLDRYPYQLSGGEIQRLAVCRALLPEPQLVILDEVTSMLDVSVQAHVVHLLKELHATRQAAFVFITHNLALAKTICDTMVTLSA